MTNTPSRLYAPKVILMGPAGTGKTYSVGTLVDCGVETFYLGIESGLEALLGYWVDRKRPIPENLHWHKIDAPKLTFTDLLGQAKDLQTYALEVLAKKQDPDRHKHNVWNMVLESMANFPDDRTGQKFGPVDDWGTDRCIIIDGLTGLSKAAMSMIVGQKAVRNQSDYQLAQTQIESFLRLICDGCPCWFVLIAHDERETDEILGGIKRMVSTLGRKLPPLIPPMFSDVILTVREGGKWTWDTTSSQADTKARNLPWAANQPPDFRKIFETWRARSAAIAPPPTASEGQAG